MNLEKEIFDIMLQDIIPNRFQPREIFNDNELQELAASIKEHGVIQPIIVRKVGDKYEIIAGERRFRASQLAGKETIPALVRDIDDKEAAKIALLENLQRSNLTPIEEAKTYQTILKIDNITQDELAANLGRSQSTIANKLRLLTLAEEVQTALLNSQISERHARSLLGLNPAQQVDLLHKTINEKLTVRQLDEEIMKLTGKAPAEVQDNIIQEGITNMNETFNNPNSQIQTININQPVQESNIETGTSFIEPIQRPAQTFPNHNEYVQENSNPVVDIPTITQQEVQQPEAPVEPVINQPEMVMEQQPSMETSLDPTIQSEIPVEPVINQEEKPVIPREGNIFDRLRVDRKDQSQENVLDLKTPNINTVINTEQEENSESYNDIYDLRFAINNFRQAVQNTEKFGFKVNTTENDLGDKYQIVIDIDKK